MARLAITGTGAPSSEPADVAGHPVWCAGGHHCTAFTMPTGEHVSIPEVWQTSFGRVVATRHRGLDRANRMELRVVLRLDSRERVAQAMCRHLVATVCLLVARVFGTDHRKAAKQAATRSGSLPRNRP